MYQYRVIFEPEESGGYYVWCPTLRAHSFGGTFDEARANIQEAVECAVESLLSHNEMVPQDRLEEQILAPVQVAVEQLQYA